MCGIVTLASALALPLAFLMRDLVAFVAFSAALGTLLLQGLTVGLLMRAAGPEPFRRRPTPTAAPMAQRPEPRPPTTAEAQRCKDVESHIIMRIMFSPVPLQ